MPDSPFHGYRGDTLTPIPPPKPRGITVAITREAGGRGSSIASAVGERLGWQVFTQESLDHLVRDSVARDELLTDLPAGAVEWADGKLGVLLAARQIVPSSLAADTARLLFALAARGEAVIVGRGAGFVLPASSTMHVRVVAPREERIAYLADWMRLTPAEAEVEVRVRDDARNKFLAQLIDGDPNDPLLYDMVLNSTRLGVEACATIIVNAVNDRHLDAADEEYMEPA